jgi:hypothetical protein
MPEERRKEYVQLDEMIDKLTGRVNDASVNIKKHDVLLIGMSTRLEVVEGYSASILKELKNGGNGIVGRLARVEARSEANEEVTKQSIGMLKNQFFIWLKIPAILGAVLTILWTLHKFRIL